MCACVHDCVREMLTPLLVSKTLNRFEGRKTVHNGGCSNMPTSHAFHLGAFVTNTKLRCWPKVRARRASSEPRTSVNRRLAPHQYQLCDVSIRILYASNGSAIYMYVYIHVLCVVYISFGFGVFFAADLIRFAPAFVYAHVGGLFEIMCVLIVWQSVYIQVKLRAQFRCGSHIKARGINVHY